jgi:hypothetical protein
MDLQELHDRELKRRVDMFGRGAVDKRMAALGEFGSPANALTRPLRSQP